MRVVHSLHEHALARQQPNIRMMIPKRITVAAAVLFVLELFERSSMAILLQKIDHASGSDAVDKTVNHGSLLLTVGDDIEMIRHDHGGKNQEAPDFLASLSAAQAIDLKVSRRKTGRRSFATEVR